MNRDRSRVSYEDARRVGPASNALVEWPVSWQYDFEANVPLVGLPSIPPL